MPDTQSVPSSPNQHPNDHRAVEHTLANESPAGSTEIGLHPPNYRLPATAHVGRVRLAVAHLARSIAFYSNIVGLAVLHHEGNFAQLGIAEDNRILLELEQLPGVHSIERRSRLGLYHTAFLLPTREDLSRFVRHLAQRGVAFGSGDHIYSEALYLTDPDGLTVEVYADRPRDQWIIEGREIVSATHPVRFDQLPPVDDASWHGAPTGTTVGHVHLYVGDLDRAARFYNAALGLDIVTWRYPGALFTSAGGYHHHVGLNVWAAGSPIAAATDARLLFWELVFPSDSQRQKALKSLLDAGYTQTETPHGAPAVTDPWGITVALIVARYAKPPYDQRERHANPSHTTKGSPPAQGVFSLLENHPHPGPKHC